MNGKNGERKWDKKAMKGELYMNERYDESMNKKKSSYQKIRIRFLHKHDAMRIQTLSTCK